MQKANAWKAAAAAAVLGLGISSMAHGALIVDLARQSGSGPVVVTSVGQVVTLNVVATVTGNDADTSNEGLAIAQGNVLGDIVNGPIGDFLSGASFTAPFNATGFTPGTTTDLNGDSHLDISGAGARSNPATAGNSFVIGTVSWTVSSLGGAGTTTLHWVAKAGGFSTSGATWTQDGTSINNSTNVATGGGGVYTAGAGVQITAAPEPGSLALLGLGGLGLLLRRRRAM